MKILTKTLLAILIICQLVCCFTGCNLFNKNGSETEDTTSSDTQSTENTDQDETFVLTKETLANYTIVIPSQADSSLSSVPTFFQTMLDPMGIKLEVKNDGEAATEYEILIGLTNRDESAEIYAEIDEDDYGYALVGKKIVLAGNTVKSVKEALLLFKKDVLDKANTQSVLLAVGDKKIIEVVEEEVEAPEYTESILNGVVINALGDSYFAGEGLPQGEIWLGLLADQYNLKMNNYGKGGSTISNYVTDKNPMCVRYNNMSNKPQPNIVLVEGGRNDFRMNVPIGTTDSRDTKTFSGALNVIVDGLKEKYPNAMIVFISNWNFEGTSGIGLKSSDYANAMEAVAEAQGIYYIAACDPEVSGIDMTDKNFRAKYCLKESDISHLNAEGMKIAFAHFTPILEEYYTDFLSKK